MEGAERNVIHRYGPARRIREPHFRGTFRHGPTQPDTPQATHTPKVPMSHTITFLCPDASHRLPDVLDCARVSGVRASECVERQPCWGFCSVQGRLN